jgi:hypothetical protein
MDFSTLLFLIFGIPLILLALGFFLLCLKWLWSKDQRANQAKLLETATKLNNSLAALEVRLTALEDILLPPGSRQQPSRHEISGQAFDRTLSGS